MLGLIFKDLTGVSTLSTLYLTFVHPLPRQYGDQIGQRAVLEGLKDINYTGSYEIGM